MKMVMSIFYYKNIFRSLKIDDKVNTMMYEEYMITCLSKTLFGYECMGCGLQRALILVFRGSFIEAFYMYAAIYPLIILLFYLTVSHFYKFKNYKKGINILSILSVTTIIISYTIKQLFI